MPVISQNSVCAVVVTFHPRSSDIANLRIVREQVQGLVVIDNGSSQPELEELRSVRCEESFELIEKGENLGIAAALNVGVRWAKSNGFEWVALFDQDSVVTDGFIAQMLADFKLYAEQRNVMQIIPRYRDPDTGEERVIFLDKDGGPFMTITSGSMFPVRVFEICGYFREELFIYAVDGDFSLRLRSAGYTIGESKNAILLHRSGTPSYHRFLGRTFKTENYRPASRYYWIRNCIWIARTYGSCHPRLIRGALRSCAMIPLKILIAEEEPWPKIAMVLRGILDGVLGRTGKTVDP